MHLACGGVMRVARATWDGQLSHTTCTLLLFCFVRPHVELKHCNNCLQGGETLLQCTELRGPSFSCREEDFEIETEEEEEEEEPWEYDSEALKHWEQFVKKSKATQVRRHGMNSQQQGICKTEYCTTCRQSGRINLRTTLKTMKTVACRVSCG